MKRYDLEKLSLKSIIIALVGLFVAVGAIILEILVIRRSNLHTGYYMLALSEIVALVFMITILTTKRPGFFRILNLVLVIVTAFAFFVLSLSELSMFINSENNSDWVRAIYSALSLFGLIVSLLHLIYFIIAKDGDTEKLERVSGIMTVVVIGLFAVAVFSVETVLAILNKTFPSLHTGLILLNLAFINLIPLLNNTKQ